MAWPSPSDFQEAVQNPRTAFTDHELQAGQPDLNTLGLPHPRSGGFAVVFKLRCNGKHWAVKCFTREFPDQHHRYAAITEHLGRVRLPYTVGFTFLPEGIKVRGRRYPILKMEWVEGESLKDYIERQLNAPHMLLILAHRWSQMLMALQEAQIAHGDLQDRNVIMVQDEIRLIDYDGMYVPALRGQGSHEVGARNYQHPLRTLADFGPHLDNFSAWVVELSLLALAAEPRLWQRFTGGDECLLLRRKDFEEPETSAVLRAIEDLHDQNAQTVAQLFRSLLYLAPEQIPSLGKPTTFAPSSHQRSLGWLEDHLPNRGVESTETQASPEPSEASQVDVSWIVEGAATPTRAESFERSPGPVRIMIGISFVTTVVLVLATQAGLIAAFALPSGVGVAGVVSLFACVLGYLSDPSVARRRAARADLREPQRKLRETKRAIDVAGRERTVRQQDHAKAEGKIVKQRKSVEEREKREISAVQGNLQSNLQDINTNRRALLQDQAAALQKIQNDVGTKVTTLNRQIADLHQAEAAELAAALRAQQQQYLNNFLFRFQLATATIPGLGPTLKSCLIAAGYKTAADIDRWVQRVQGIGHSRASALAAWKQALERRAQSGMPQSLSVNDTETIQSKYRSQRVSLETERDRYQRVQRDEEQGVRARDRFKLDDFDRAENQAKKVSAEQVAQIQNGYAGQYAPLAEALGKLVADLQGDLTNIDGKVNELRKETFQLTWQEAQAKKQLNAFAAITFSRYLRRVFLAR